MCANVHLIKQDLGSFTTPRRVAGYALQYADANLRADGDVVLEAVRQNVYSMEFAADELKSDRAFILKATQCCPEEAVFFILLNSVMHPCRRGAGEVVAA